MEDPLPKIDLEQARKFLETLDRDGNFMFQTFPEGRNSSHPPRAEKFLGTAESALEKLTALNLVKPSSGAFVTICKTDGQGRKKENIVAVRAVFVDLDGAPLKPILQFSLPPSLVVNTSPEKFHAYWLVSDCPLEEFSSMQKALSQKFDGDPAVNDLPRVMRLPGFLHHKDPARPFMSSLVKISPENVYGLEELKRALELDEPSEEKVICDQEQREDGVGKVKAMALAGQAAVTSIEKPSTGRHGLALKLGWDCRKAGLNVSDASHAAHVFAQNARQGNSDGSFMPLMPAETESAVLNAFREGKEVDVQRSLSSLILTAPELVALDIPPRRELISPFLTEGSLNMVYAKRGVGKTWFVLELAKSLTLGKKFFAWDVPEPVPVLLIDGEMPIADMKQRIQQLFGSSTPDEFRILASERLYTEELTLKINKSEDQGRIDTMLSVLEKKGKPPKVIIFDNLSSLTAGIEENSNSDLDDLSQWLITLRHRGYAIIEVHHSGKSGDQRGASRREDLLDTSIALEAPPDMEASNGACFDIIFSKTRGRRPNPDTVNVKLTTLEHGNLEWTVSSTKKEERWGEILDWIEKETPKIQREIAEHFNVSTQAISKHIGKLRKRRYLFEGGLSVTPQGMEFLVKLRNQPF